MTALLDTATVIVGQSGSGKTVTAKADVAQLLEQRRHVAIVDPTGVWWGMRSNAAGDGPGFDLPIFGGEHGDVPIRADQGAAIARIIVGQRVSAIVDLSAIDNSRDWRRFVHDFVAELRKKPKGNFHLVVDEADEFAAERIADDVGFALRENMVWIAKRGRVAGFVPTYITQRTAEIAKAVISQAQTLVVHQLISPADQKAIDDYLKGHGSPDVRREVMASLAELEVGERWVYSPRLKVLERGVTPALATYDSSRTPAPGEQLVEPRTLAQLDVSEIRAALAPPADEYHDDTIPEDAIEAYAKGSVVGAMLRERDERIAELEADNAELREMYGTLERHADWYDDELTDIESRIAACRRAPHAPAPRRLDDLGSVQDGRKMSMDGPPSRGSDARDVQGNDRCLTGGETPLARAPVSAGARPEIFAPTAAARGRKALVALAAAAPAVLTEAQWATLAGYAKTGGTWSTYKSALRAAGLIEQDAAGRWFASPAGMKEAGVIAEPLPPAGADRARFWSTRVPGVRRMVDVLIRRWPRLTTRDSIAGDLNMTATGGTFGTYLGRLRANGLIEEQGKSLRLSTDVMGAE